MTHRCGRKIGNGKDTPILIEYEQGKPFWNSPKVWKWFEASDAQIILSTYAPMEEMGDEMIWLHKENGDYIVKSGYWFLQICKKPKLKSVSQRLRSFYWKLSHNALPTKDNLLERKIEVNPDYVFCGEREMINHLFLNCEITKRIWRSSTLGLVVPDRPTQDTPTCFKNMFTYLFKIRDKLHQAWPYIIFTTWAIWIHINNDIFRNGRTNPQEVVKINLDATTEKEQASWEWGTAHQSNNILRVDGTWKKQNLYDLPTISRSSCIASRCEECNEGMDDIKNLHRHCKNHSTTS
ncbi:hypothetical protein RDABS01_031312 [Bienertia sinuspersici]